MKLNHLDLRVLDVQAFARFLTTFFGFAVTSTNKTSPAIVFLDDGHGFSLVLQRSTEPVAYPEDFHLGFVVSSPEEVDRVRDVLHEGGVEVGEVTRNGRGTQLYLYGPERILFEVSCPR